MSGSKKRNIRLAIGLGVIAVGVLAVRMFSSDPIPVLHSASAAAQQISELPLAAQQEAAREYGGRVAKMSTWSDMIERGAALSDEHQANYFSAVAYSDYLEGSTDEEFMDNLQAHVPIAYQAIFCNGMVRLYAREHAQTPDEVMSYVDALGGGCGGADLTDGLRMGVVQAVGDNLGEAFAVVETYPPDLHDAMVEELGWRYGERKGMDLDGWKSAEYVVPAHNLCSMACGVTLGAMHRSLANEEAWADAFSAYSSALPHRCQEAAMEGLADSLLFVLGPDDATLESAVTQLDAQMQNQLQAQLAIRLVLLEAQEGEPARSDRLLALSPSQQRHAAQALGFLAGLEHGYGAMVLFSESLSPKLAEAFHDGLAQGVEPDWEQPEEWVQSIQRMIPPAHQRSHLAALIRAYTEANVDAPDKVVAFAERIGQLTDGHALEHGVRVGFQRALGGDMQAALAAVPDYPASLQSALYEELGSRLGEDVGLSQSAWSEVASTVKEADACTIGAGMVRGFMLKEVRQGESWAGTIQNFSSQLPTACRPSVQKGIADSLRIALGHDLEALEQAVALTAQPEQIRTLISQGRDGQAEPEAP